MLYLGSAQSAQVPANSDDFDAAAIGEGQSIEVCDPALPSDPPESKITGLRILLEACGVFSWPQNTDDTCFKYAVSLTMRFPAKSLELVLPVTY